jgi:hypothetical protein
MGWFTAACLTLMAYDVPSDAVGLDQGRGQPFTIDEDNDVSR